MAVYFFAVDGRIKIGYSAKPKTRMSDHGRQFPDLEMLRVIAGSVNREKDIHRQFASDHIQGEWFRDSASLRTAIAALPEQANEKPQPHGPFLDFMQREALRKRLADSFLEPAQQNLNSISSLWPEIKRLPTGIREIASDAEAAAKWKWMVLVTSYHSDDGASFHIREDVLGHLRLIRNLIDCNAEEMRRAA